MADPAIDPSQAPSPYPQGNVIIHPGIGGQPQVNANGPAAPQLPQQQPQPPQSNGQGGVDPRWSQFQVDFAPEKIGQTLQTQGASPKTMQMGPSLTPAQKVDQGWSQFSVGYEPEPYTPPPMSQSEAALHSALHGASAGFSPAIAGVAAVGGLAQYRDDLEQQQAQGWPYGNGEQELAHVRKLMQDSGGGVYRQYRDAAQSKVAQAQQQYPWTSTAGDIGGAIASSIPFGIERAGAEVAAQAPKAAEFGGKLVEPLVQKGEQAANWVKDAMGAAKSGSIYGALSGAGNSVSQGDNLGTVVQNAGVGAGVGALGGTLLSPIASAVGHGAGFAADRLKAMYRGITHDLGVNPAERAAESAVQNAEQQGANYALPRTPEEWKNKENVWRQPGQIRDFQRAGNLAEDEGALVRGSKGDLATARLSRRAADTSPVAADIIKKQTDTTFANQAKRVANGIRIMLLGKQGRKQITLDDIDKKLAEFKEQARRESRINYNTLYGAYNKGIWSPELERLTGADPVQDAMRSAYKGWQTRAIADHGIGAPTPGIAVSGGAGVIRKKGANADTPIIPNIQFWDYAKRELDKQINAAAKTGGGDYAVLVSLKNQLRAELDRLTNGAYGHTLQGAAAKFKAAGVDADDMFEAGQKFVSEKGNREMDGKFEDILGKATPAEKELFKYGVISQLLDHLENAAENRNVINERIFGAPGKGSESARRRLKMALGEDGYKRVEALMTVEAAMDNMRQAQGNSITGRLVKEYFNEAALSTGAALFGYEHWRDMDPEEPLDALGKVAAFAGLLFGAYAGRRGRKFDEQVAIRIAQKLISSPDGERELVDMATHSPVIMDWLRKGGKQFADFAQKAGNAANRGAGVGSAAYAQVGNRGAPITVGPADHFSPQ